MRSNFDLYVYVTIYSSTHAVTSVLPVAIYKVKVIELLSISKARIHSNTHD